MGWMEQKDPRVDELMKNVIKLMAKGFTACICPDGETNSPNSSSTSGASEDELGAHRLCPWENGCGKLLNVSV